MKKVIITGYTAKSEGVILETNIPARLNPNRMPSKETFVSWDKIGKVLFENYTELEGVTSCDSIRNNSSLKEEVEKKHQRINVELGEKCVQNYEGRKVNCVVTRVDGDTFNATILGLGVEMVNIPNEKFNPKYCMPDEVDTKEEHEQYLKDIEYTTYRVRLLQDDKWQVIDESENVLHQGNLSDCESWIKLKERGAL